MATGWYKLPKSGHPFYGPIPDGADEIDAPSPAVSEVAESEHPPKGAKVAVWREHARGLGVRGNVDKMTKADLIEAVEELVDAGEDDVPVDGEVADVELGSDTQEPGAVPDQEDQA